MSVQAQAPRLDWHSQESAEVSTSSHRLDSPMDGYDLGQGLTAGVADQLMAQLQAMRLGAGGEGLRRPDDLLQLAGSHFPYGMMQQPLAGGAEAAAAAAAASSGGMGMPIPLRADHMQRLTGSPAPPSSHSSDACPTSMDSALLDGSLLARLQQQQAAVAAAAAAVAAGQQQAPGQTPAGFKRRAGGGSGNAGATRRTVNEDKVRRTVYISDLSEAVSEAALAAAFRGCGQVVDCRVCGDPNSTMRFAFIEFVDEAGAHQALSRSGSLLGEFPIRVSPSKTAIVPVNNTYLPRSGEERELLARTVFVGNIDRVVERDQLRDFFQNLCGRISKIRLLGDTQHSSKIAFIEFASAESALGALKLSGALLGTLPLRVSPSKTPVRVDARRTPGAEARGSYPAAAPPVSAAAAAAAAAAMSQHAALQAGPYAWESPALLMAVAGLQLYPHY